MPLPRRWDLETLLELLYNSRLTSSIVKNIIEGFDSYESFIESDSPYRHFQSKSSTIFSNDNIGKIQIREIIETCESMNYSIVTFWDNEYPELLKRIQGPPLVIYVKGNLKRPEHRAIAIVGTRKLSVYGKLITEHFASHFANNNIIVVSGLAQGIDTTAHLSAVKNDGTTYAVVASGLDKISPMISVKNVHKIIEAGGAVISEYRPGINAKPIFFPQRNRIISGLSSATVVIESGEKGGALITAKFAFDQQREVFAVPGNINSQNSIGTNLLIKNNIASIALSPQQILFDLGWSNQEIFTKNESASLKDSNEKLVYEYLSGEPQQIDNISVNTNIAIPELLVKLLDMEFRGIIRQLPGKYYVRTM